MRQTKLGRTSSHRKATFRSLVTSLFRHGRIKTTEAKARELRPIAEKLITKAKVDDLHARRMVASYVRDKEVVKTLFSEIAPKYSERPGGYTRVIKVGVRRGDAADEAIIELV